MYAVRFDLLELHYYVKCSYLQSMNETLQEGECVSCSSKKHLLNTQLNLLTIAVHFQDFSASQLNYTFALLQIAVL